MQFNTMRRILFPEKERMWKVATADRRRVNAKAYRAANPERCRQWKRDWRARNVERSRAMSRKSNGIPEPTRPAPVTCELCNRGEPRGLFVDHDHATGLFRGWLCHKCNTGLGHFRDDRTLLLRAARYLQGPLL